MFTPAKERRKQTTVKDCYLIEELPKVVSTGHMFSAKFLQELGLNREASYFETLEEAQAAFRKTNDPSNIIILLKDVPLEFYEKKADGSYNLKRDNVSLLRLADRFIEGIYFIPCDKMKSDFIYQAKSPSADTSLKPNKSQSKCTIL